MAKGFKKGAGGANPLNFKVVGGTTEPANPKENVIWVNTDQKKIPGWYFQHTQPEDGDEGEIWFDVGISSTVKFNALKKNSLMVYPISTKQYIGGVWVNKIAKIRQNGEWNDLVRYFYRTGNTYDDVTGGWGHTKYESAYGKEASVTFETNRIKITSSSDTSYVTFVHTKNKVNVSDISQISVKLDSIKEFYQKVLVIDDGTSGNTPAASIAFTGDYAELDISKYSGSYYVGVVFKNTAVQARVAEEYITEVGYA